MVVKIDKNELIAILNDWNSWGKEMPTGVPRPLYFQKLRHLISGRQVVIVTGARRAGKSVLMRQAGSALVAEGMQKENILFVNFEDPRFPPLTGRFLDQVFET